MVDFFLHEYSNETMSLMDLTLSDFGPFIALGVLCS